MTALTTPLREGLYDFAALPVNAKIAAIFIVSSLTDFTNVDVLLSNLITTTSFPIGSQVPSKVIGPVAPEKFTVLARVPLIFSLSRVPAFFTALAKSPTASYVNGMTEL